MASSGTVPSQAFQPLSAKNFLSLKTTAKPVPRHQDASAAAATSPVDHSGHNRRVVGGGGGVGGNKPSNHSHSQNSHARSGRNATTMSHQPPSSSSDHDGHQSKSYLDTADLLADLPYQQLQLHHNHHSAVSDHSIGSIVISPNRNHESSISNIIRENDLAVMENHQLQQGRGSSQPQSFTRWQSSSDHNPKNQKVRFEHLRTYLLSLSRSVGNFVCPEEMIRWYSDSYSSQPSYRTLLSTVSQLKPRPLSKSDIQIKVALSSATGSINTIYNEISKGRRRITGSHRSQQVLRRLTKTVQKAR